MSIFTLISCFVVPLVMVAFGAVFSKGGPKRISWLYGYRTKRSMKNRETWDYAHRYCGDLWSKLGAPMLAVTCVIVMLLALNKERTPESAMTWGLIIVVVQLAVLLLSMRTVEKVLSQVFDEKGKRKSDREPRVLLATRNDHL